jgi:hypothetical protein
MQFAYSKTFKIKDMHTTVITQPHFRVTKRISHKL